MTDEDVPSRRHCATSEVHRQLLSVDPDYRQARSDIENLTDAIQARGFAAAAPRTRTIPVVVHVVYRTDRQNISNAQIQSQIRILNQDFRMKNRDRTKLPDVFQPLHTDTRIQFRLASKDIFGNATSGITRTRTSMPSFGFDEGVKSSRTGGADPWPTRRYLNIWVCNLGDGLLGYAQFPGGPRATDGVVILHTAFGNTGTARAPFDRGRTTTHEVGHWLNLFHIWGDDGTGCRGSDHCPDTPNQASENYGEPVFPHVSCNNGPNGDLFMNYMDYVDDRAMFMFTAGQATRMNAALNGPRKELFEALPRYPGVLGPSPRRKPAVKKVQEVLRDRFDHPDLLADGVYGERTERIVRTFQRRRHGPPWNLPVDGKVGKRTWAALFA
jgi:Pregnancy-associated plasma protein-A/Putative peptidoglycan binding domain